MLLNSKQVAIVGGGPGGLILARLLQLKGANVKVYERDVNKDARLIGSPLDMHEGSGLTALRTANLLEAFKKNFRPGADRKLIVDEQAKIFFSDHDTKPAEDFDNPHFHPEIDRGPLRALLLESLQPGTMVWDSHFMSMEAREEGWLLHFKNGSSVYADVVIAADGANSKIRPYLTSIKAFYSGVTMLEGNIPDASNAAPHIYSLLNGGKLMAYGHEHNLLMGLKGNGDLTFYASFKPAANWATDSGINFSDKTQLLAWFKNEYAGWSNIWYELFENAATPFIPRPIYCMPLDQSWTTLSNLTLLGDAAHVMPPFAGEGANMAMLDALELSEYLTSGQYGTMQEAISAYETNMRKRAAAAAKQSLDNGERMHSKNALHNMLSIFGGHHN
ncbi:FAD-dependent oxidoreductase [Chitinophaga arvensicola]|uniref:Flavin-dependent monooxygenase n=1 Tax=Chitinophaga arvensicola TaxID=29529 RepID=A0A1I0SAE4_9BACT|nr:NAD(P)/FAD-dependent oxidoreductase [Chitinophaga arvensicola]SEW53477.1 2-polyprenyl-6-methoxyphenol hydroxylase [Chitinophaga arvensicola]